MRTNADPSELHDLLLYDRDTGFLYWRPRDRGYFKTDLSFHMWNSRYAGTEALATRHEHGYKEGRIFYKHYKSHRVIWAMEHGYWPEQIDHLNGERSDNRLCNLVESCYRDNAINKRRTAINRSGHTGVHFAKREQRWVAYIKRDGLRKHLGYFDDLSDAVKARKRAEIDYGFHENHGDRVVREDYYHAARSS